ncbi:MAG TPA: NUDIX hydrolase [Anaerolineales bacterium]|nr:NUDIX hydrolase [Anaerolineales bacterium]
MNFEKISSSIEYYGRAFNVRKDHFRTPSNRTKAYDVIDHVNSVCMVPIDSQGHIYFIRQFRPAIGEHLLELPAGTLDNEEPFEQGCMRELREEIGMEAKNVLRLGAFYLAPGYCTELMEAFLASELVENPLPPDDDEYLELIKIPIKIVYQMVNEGKITDSKSLAALLLAKAHFEKQLTD